MECYLRNEINSSEMLFIGRVQSGCGGGTTKAYTRSSAYVTAAVVGGSEGLDIKMKMPHIKFIQLSKRPICRL